MFILSSFAVVVLFYLCLHPMTFTYSNIHLSMKFLRGDTSKIPAFCFKLTKLFLNYNTYLILYALQQRLIQFVPFPRQQLLYLKLKSRFEHVQITKDIVTLIRFIVVALRNVCCTWIFSSLCGFINFSMMNYEPISRTNDVNYRLYSLSSQLHIQYEKCNSIHAPKRSRRSSYSLSRATSVARRWSPRLAISSPPWTSL